MPRKRGNYIILEEKKMSKLETTLQFIKIIIMIYGLFLAQQLLEKL